LFANECCYFGSDITCLSFGSSAASAPAKTFTKRLNYWPFCGVISNNTLLLFMQAYKLTSKSQVNPAGTLVPHVTCRSHFIIQLSSYAIYRETEGRLGRASKDMRPSNGSGRNRPINDSRMPAPRSKSGETFDELTSARSLLFHVELLPTFFREFQAHINRLFVHLVARLH
jgi:hypothetical protein